MLDKSQVEGSTVGHDQELHLLPLSHASLSAVGILKEGPKSVNQLRNRHVAMRQ
jgi:hypothetical protein